MLPAWPGISGAAAVSRAVIIGRAADASRLCRVDAPDRVLRIWAMLASADDGLHQARLRPEAVARLRRQLDVLTAELERSLSRALAWELHHLVGRKAGTGLTADELRVEYATLLSWMSCRRRRTHAAGDRGHQDSIAGLLRALPAAARAEYVGSFHADPHTLTRRCCLGRGLPGWVAI